MNLEGVDVVWVRAQLDEFVEQTRAVGLSSGSVLTTRTRPACGRERAIELTEIVRPILDRLYPGWTSENIESKNDEFKRERGAARRLAARLENHAEIALHLGGADASPTVRTSAMHPLIWEAARTQWSTGHRHEAVLAAAKAVNSNLQTKLGRRDISETDLIRQALSEKDPEAGKPRLRFADVEDNQTRESMRQGVMNFGVGCFGAIRNPVGHLPNSQLDLPEHVAIEQLASLSLLARWLDAATLIRVGER